MMPEEYYEFERILEGLDEEFALMALGIIGLVMAVAGLVAVVLYIFQSVALYSMAKNRGIANPWLAWLPIGNYWIAGSIADQYQYVVNGQVKSKRVILLVLSIAGAVVSSLVSSVATGSFLLTTGEVNMEHLLALGSVGTVANLVTFALQLTTFVFWQMALYDIYTSCNPKYNVLFLVLGIIFGVTIPFFLFFNRKKELGMPPRKHAAEQPQYHYNYQPYESPEEPWNNN